MFGRGKKNENELEQPEVVVSDPNAREVLRVWQTPNGNSTFTLKIAWDDPGNWGILLVDVARHLSRAYERQGLDANVTLGRIKKLWDAEWSNPTDLGTDITPPK